jgi:hypothetical protein
MDRWAWEQLTLWLQLRATLPLPSAPAIVRNFTSMGEWDWPWGDGDCGYPYHLARPTNRAALSIAN